MRIPLLGLSLAAFALAVNAADLAGVKAEPDAAKRSELAIGNAHAALDEARTAFEHGDQPKMDNALREVGDSVDLCYESLKASRQNPHRSKYYKHAELRLRELVRMISGFGDQLPFDQRATAAEVQKNVQTIHDKILVDELEKK